MTGKIQQVGIRGGCAHGLPPGACPICSGGGSGGGGSSVKKSNQMSWSECYAIGQQMKAARERAMDNKAIDMNAQAKTAAMNKQDLALIQNTPKLSNVINILPNNIKTPIENIKQKVGEFFNRVADNINKFANAVNEKIALIKEKMQQLANTLTNIMDKMAAIFGEQQNKINDLINKNLKKIKKKLFAFFESIDAEMEQGKDEDYKELEELLEKEQEKYE